MDVARRALELARDVERRVDGHEDICAIRYKQLDTNINDVKRIISWAGVTGFTVIMGALAFFIKGQFDANVQLQKAVQEIQQTQSAFSTPARPQ